MVSKSTITTTTTNGDGDRVLTIPIRPAEATTILKDRLYASMSAATNSPELDTHELSVTIDDDGEINLHFRHIYICMSDGDWDRVVNAVAEARAAAGKDAAPSEPPQVLTEQLPAGIVAARSQRTAGISR
jgi:hypothetical protein